LRLAENFPARCDCQKGAGNHSRNKPPKTNAHLDMLREMRGPNLRKG